MRLQIQKAGYLVAANDAVTVKDEGQRLAAAEFFQGAGQAVAFKGRFLPAPGAFVGISHVDDAGLEHMAGAHQDMPAEGVVHHRIGRRIVQAVELLIGEAGRGEPGTRQICPSDTLQSLPGA